MKKMLLVTVFMLSFYGCGLVGIEDGQKGVKADFGKIQEEAIGTGWQFFILGITWVEKWNVKTQELKETANVPSSEGLISTLDISVLYKIPPDKVVFVRKTIGQDYKVTVLEPYVREAIRNVASGYEVKSLYSDKGRKEIGEKMKQFLVEKLSPRGIIIEDILLRDVRLPQTFSSSIEAKLKAEQESLQKEFELQKARKDAEIEIAHAEGIAASNKIIANSITENYLRYKFIDNLGKGSNEIIYVPTEANLPILEAGRMKQ